MLSPRPTGMVYTSTACTECSRSKTRCQQQRPCSRCVRIGLVCIDPHNRNMFDPMLPVLIPPSLTPGSIRFPQPDLHEMYESLCVSMTSLSPFTVADCVLDEQSLWFVSTIGCLGSLIPTSKTVDLTRRLVAHSSFAPEDYSKVAHRLACVQQDISITGKAPRISRIPLASPLLKMCHFTDLQLLNYFMHTHVFNTPTDDDFPRDYGVSVSIFKREAGSSKVVLTHHLSPNAEAIFGLSNAQFAEMSTNFGTSNDYNAQEFPQTLCLFHNTDIFSYCSDSLRAFVNPGQEIRGRVRIVHFNGTFIPCTYTKLVILYADGGIRAIVSQLIPDRQ